MTNALPRRFVLVAPPNVLTAIGEVLRKAFGKPASGEKFEPILLRLNRH